MSHRLRYLTLLSALLMGGRALPGAAQAAGMMLAVAPEAAAAAASGVAPGAASGAAPTATSALAPAWAALADSVFSYQAPTPVGGRLRGVIELGAVGFNAYLLRVDQRRHWRLERAEFNKSYIIKNMATSAQIERGVRLYAQQLLNAGVARPDLHVVVSSGAAQAQVTAGLTQQLQAASYQVTTVTPEQEGSYDLAAVLPPELANEAFVVDLGSSNTKISWLDARGQPHTALTYGARYDESVVLRTPAVLADVRAKASQVPVGQRRRCFLMGGTAYELARPLRRGTERYTVLTSLVRPLPAASEPLTAGQRIVQALVEATGCQQFVFDWDASFAVGYLLARP